MYGHVNLTILFSLGQFQWLEMRSDHYFYAAINSQIIAKNIKSMCEGFLGFRMPIATTQNSMNVLLTISSNLGKCYQLN